MSNNVSTGVATGDPDELLRPEQVAQILGVSMEFLLKDRQRKENRRLAFVRIAKNRVRYKRVDLRNFIESRRES